MTTQKNKICPDCGKEIWSGSTRCKSCAHKGKLGWWFGKKHSIETLKKMSGKNSPRWKGDKAGSKAIHLWVNSHKGKPHICKFCGIPDFCPSCHRTTRVEWANIDHKCRRNLNDYIALCCGCHLKYDLDKGLRTYIPKSSSITGKFI